MAKPSGENPTYPYQKIPQTELNETKATSANANKLKMQTTTFFNLTQKQDGVFNKGTLISWRAW